MALKASVSKACTTDDGWSCREPVSKRRTGPSIRGRDPSRYSKSQAVLAHLLEHLPGRFSSELGLHLNRRRPRDLSLWFLAALLYGARISGTIVRRTHAEFIRRGLTTPALLVRAGWDQLVDALDAGGYVRYDYKTATKLLQVMRTLQRRYHGDLTELLGAAKDREDVENRLRALGKGIGDVTIQIFLRELRDEWANAEPALSPFTMLAAEHLRLVRNTQDHDPMRPIRQLRRCWEIHGVQGQGFADFEAALLRLGRDYCRRSRCDRCPMQHLCPSREMGTRTPSTMPA